LSALIADNGLVIHFMGCDGDFDYIPPVWPEEPCKQQKQCTSISKWTICNLPWRKAIRLGATKALNNMAASICTILDTEGQSVLLVQEINYHF